MENQSVSKHTRLVSVSGRSYRATPTMTDIFLAHASDTRSRGVLALVPLVHDSGVEMLLIGEETTITVSSVVETSAPVVTPAA